MVNSPVMWSEDNSFELECTCPICLDFYSDPVCLSCSHVFCFVCIQNWMGKQEDLILTCPMCREEKQKFVMHDSMIRQLIFLIRQHGPILKQHMWQLTEPLGLYSEDVALEAETLEAETGNTSLAPSNDLGSVCCRKPGCNLEEDSRIFTPLACVLESSLLALEVDIGKEKEETPDDCKEAVCRRNPGHNLVDDPLRFTFLACVLDSSHFLVGHWEVTWERERMGSRCLQGENQQEEQIVPL